MTSDDTGDEVKDRFAQRFETEAATSERSSGPGESEQKEKTSKKEKTVNIKEEYRNHSFYLPPGLASDLSRSYKQLDLDLDEEYGFSIQKTRHYYPLIVKLGLQRLGRLESKEVKEEIEKLEP